VYLEVNYVYYIREYLKYNIIYKRKIIYSQSVIVTLNYTMCDCIMHRFVSVQDGISFAT
jgi:hypothetical protein